MGCGGSVASAPGGRYKTGGPHEAALEQNTAHEAKLEELLAAIQSPAPDLVAQVQQLKTSAAGLTALAAARLEELSTLRKQAGRAPAEGPVSGQPATGSSPASSVIPPLLADTVVVDTACVGTGFSSTAG